MGRRSNSRRLAMQVLYQADIRKVDPLELIDDTFDTSPSEEETKLFAQSLITGVQEHLKDIDLIIVQKSIGWTIDRISSLDRNILRLAIYEIVYGDTPATIAIDEAVELAKRFSTDESPKFINGILGNLESERQKKCLQE